MEFDAHGSYQIEVQENIVYVKAYGPFNDMFSHHYKNEMKRLMSRMKGKKWATLVTFYGNSIFTPEAESDLVELSKTRSKHGMVANAAIFKNSVHTDLQQMQLKRIYDEANIPCHIFPEKSSAKSWLHQMLN